MNRRTLLKLLGVSLITPTHVLKKLASAPTKAVVDACAPPVTAIGWSANDAELFNRLPFYLTKTQVDRTKLPLLLKRKWEPNMGNVMRGVK